MPICATLYNKQIHHNNNQSSMFPQKKPIKYVKVQKHSKYEFQHLRKRKKPSMVAVKSNPILNKIKYSQNCHNKSQIEKVIKKRTKNWSKLSCLITI